MPASSFDKRRAFQRGAPCFDPLHAYWTKEWGESFLSRFGEPKIFSASHPATCFSPDFEAIIDTNKIKRWEGFLFSKILMSPLQLSFWWLHDETSTGNNLKQLRMLWLVYYLIWGLSYWRHYLPIDWSFFVPQWIFARYTIYRAFWENKMEEQKRSSNPWIRGIEGI